MFPKADLSILQPFLDVERLTWADVVQFGDDILEMGTVPETADQFRRLLQELQTSPGKPLVFRHTDLSFSPERCDAALRRLGEWSEENRVEGAWPTPFYVISVAREANACSDLISWLGEVRRPTIMVFQGSVALSFLGIGLACDYRIAAVDTIFCNHGRTRDLLPGPGLLYLLPAYVGRGRANALVTRVEEMPAHSAFEWGLLDEVSVPAEMEQTLQGLAAEVSCFSPETFGTIRQLLNRHLPAFNAYFGQEVLGLQRSVRGRPWERLSSRDTTDSTPGANESTVG
jgi:hypothetical protein